jgi:TPR repeat protein
MPKRYTLAAAMTLLTLGAPALAGATDRTGTNNATLPAPAPAPMSLEGDARDGDPMSQFVTGRRYLIQAANTGRADLKGQGLAYLEAAAAQGFAPAARFAGSLFLSGDYVAADINEAVNWFERAAALGDADSQQILADLYADGGDVPQDLEQAARLYEDYLANPDAMHEPDAYWERTHRLAVLYAEGVGVKADPERARSLWARAANEGHYPPAQEGYAKALAQGIGGPADPEGAVAAYYTAAASYLESGLRFDIGPETAKAEAQRLLAEMQRIQPDARLTRLLERQLTRS